MPGSTLIVGKTGPAKTTRFEDLDREALNIRLLRIIPVEAVGEIASREVGSEKHDDVAGEACQLRQDDMIGPASSTQKNAGCRILQYPADEEAIGEYLSDWTTQPGRD